MKNNNKAKKSSSTKPSKTSNCPSRSGKNSNSYDLNSVGGHSPKRYSNGNPYDLNYAGFKR